MVTTLQNDQIAGALLVPLILAAPLWLERSTFMRFEELEVRNQRKPDARGAIV